MATIYQIRVAGHLDPTWSAWFDGLSIIHQPNGDTLLVGPIVDQAALHGVLLKVSDLGLTLIAVTRVAPHIPGAEGAGNGRTTR